MAETDRNSTARGNAAGSLDALLEQAREARPEPSGAMLARVLADAEAVDAARRESAQQRAGAPRTGIRGFLSAIGGWPAVAGMAAATLAGVWIGVSPPELLDTAGEELLVSETDSYLSDAYADFAFYMEEG